MLEVPVQFVQRGYGRQVFPKRHNGQFVHQRSRAYISDGGKAAG